MEIINFSGELAELSELAANYLMTMQAVQGIKGSAEPAQGLLELQRARAQGWPIYAALVQSAPRGFLVCRFEADGVWLEALYVDPAFRRQGIGGTLFHQAEQVAKELGKGSLRSKVPPGHEVMMAFLRSQGYHCLDHVVIRKADRSEQLDHSISLGGNQFRLRRPLSTRKLVEGGDPGGKRKRRRKKKLGKPLSELENWGEEFGQDEYFYFIAGFTDHGVPFGVTWEQACEEGLLTAQDFEERGLADRWFQGIPLSDEELPF